MAKIQNEILQAFLAELEKANDFSEDRVKRLREVFTNGKKVKAEELVKVLSEDPKEQLS